MNKKQTNNEDAFFIPALAFFALVVFLIIVTATIVPPIKQTIIEFMGVIFK